MATKKELGKAEVSKDNYSEFAKVAYNTAYNITRERENSEDIAQLVTMRLYLNQDNINPDSTRNWVITTSKNESYLLLNKNNKEQTTVRESFDNVEQQITDSLLENKGKSKEIELLLKKLNADFPKEERAILKKYFLKGQKLSELYAKQEIATKKSTLYQKIYRLRKEVRAEYCKSTGMKASKDIVSFNLHQSIMRFIKKYKECIEKKSFQSMKLYFESIGIPKSIPRLSISKIIDYDIHLIGQNEYEAAVYFIDNRKTVDCYVTRFSFSDNKNLIIKELPNNSKFTHCSVINENKVPLSFIESIDKTNSEGYIPLNDEEIVATLDSLNKSSYRVKTIKKPRNIRLQK